MCDTKKQRWDEAIIRSPNAWSMPEELEPPKKRNTDLRPYARLVQHQLDDVHESEDDAEHPEPDVDDGLEEHLSLPRLQRKLAFIADWKQHELLELLKQQVDLEKASIVWLQWFREDLDLKV